MDGALVITAVSEGEATLTVSDAEGNAVCTVEVLVGTSVTQDCFDNDGDTLCDVCGAEIPCAHRHLKPVYEPVGDETHDIVMTCKCGDAVSRENAACISADGDLVCDLCGSDLSCKHTDRVTTFEDNGDGTHAVIVICVCGEPISETTEPCADEDGDGYCDGCEAVVEAEPECDHSNTTTETV
ncbi:MAG: hypothetical protein IJ944_01405, partial [Clostridia bacterium]|nr:hypothetical protein [Clostridia bacterium]